MRYLTVLYRKRFSNIFVVHDGKRAENGCLVNAPIAGITASGQSVEFEKKGSRLVLAFWKKDIMKVETAGARGTEDL